MKTSQREFLVHRALAILVMASLIMTFSLICRAPHARAQSAVAALSGTVIDAQGGAIPGATVRIANPSTGFRREVTTNNEGIYTFPSLAPGNYTVTVEGQGFATAELKDVALNVNDQRSLRIQLKVGGVGETIQVTDTLPLIDQSSSVSTVVDRQFVENLPMNGRSFQSLIALTPGVVVAGTSLTDQGQFSVNGQRRSSNAFYVDGVSANFGGSAGANLFQFAGGSLPALSGQGGTNNLLSVDAMQEFTIQTSTYAAEFGRQPGAQISITTRSGTNRFSGVLFEYLRNDKTDANNWFNNRLGLPKPPLRQNQFGGVLGGPVLLPRFGEGGRQPWYDGRNRTFFFFSYEGLRSVQPATRQTEAPSLAARAAAPASLKPFFNAYPLPNGPETTTRNASGGPAGLAQFNASFSEPSDLNTYGIRLDHTVSQRLQLFGRYNDAVSSILQRGTVSNLSLNSILVTDYKTRTLTLGAISPLTSRLVNDFRFNYSTQKIISTISPDSFGGAAPVPASAFFTSPQPFSESNALFLIQVSVGRQTSFSLGKNANNTQRQIDIVDNLTFVKGSHSLKFGIGYRRLAPIFAPRDYIALVVFQDFLNPSPSSLTVAPSREGRLYFTNFGAYGQDTWKASRRLTLTYGLRWDIDLSPTLGGGVQPVSVTSAGFADLTKLALAPPGTPLWRNRYNNFAPRIGAAYQLRNKAGWETMLRGGFGVFYDLASQYAGQIAQFNYPPFGASKTILSPVLGGAVAPVFPIPPSQAEPPPFGVNPPLPGGMTFFNPDLRSPYSFQWNFAVEQSVGGHQTISASYVASAGRRLLQQEQISTPANAPLNGVFASPVLLDNTADSVYHSLQLQFQRRLSRGLQALASYTWAHFIDSASTAGFSGTNSFSRSRPGANRADSDNDIRHAFNAGVTYDIPAPFERPAARALLGGWSLDGIFTARTATPLTIIASGLLPPFETASTRPDLAPGVPIYLTGPQFPGGKAINPAAFVRPPTVIDAAGVRRPARQGNAGRNTFRGFGAHQVDFALRRQFKLTERVNLQFRAELFNAFNHANFGGVNTVLNFNATTGLPAPSATFGQATGTLGQSLGSGGANGGFTPLYQIGGPRSSQFSLRLQF
ncbi:MAG: TonB-dependent receptor domain-containing protein [Blastocatellia bacterium]